MAKLFQIEKKFKKKEQAKYFNLRFASSIIESPWIQFTITKIDILGIFQRHILKRYKYEELMINRFDPKYMKIKHTYEFWFMVFFATTHPWDLSYHINHVFLIVF